MNAIHPFYPDAEDRADVILAQQRAAEAEWRALMRRTADKAMHLVEQMPLGLHLRGYDAPCVLTMLARDFQEFSETTMQEAMEATEQ